MENLFIKLTFFLLNTELWQKKHRHQFEGPRKAEGKLTSVIKELLVQKLESKAERSGLQIPNLNDGAQRGSIVVNEQEQNQNRRMPGIMNMFLKFQEIQKCLRIEKFMVKDRITNQR